jgi:hypothetical protein
MQVRACNKDPKRCKAPADLAEAHNAKARTQLADLMSSLQDLKTKGATAADPRVKNILRKRDALVNDVISGAHARAVFACQARACPDDVKSAVKMVRTIADAACNRKPSIKEGCKLRDAADKVIKAPAVSPTQMVGLMKQMGAVQRTLR